MFSVPLLLGTLTFSLRDSARDIYPLRVTNNFATIFLGTKLRILEIPLLLTGLPLLGILSFSATVTGNFSLRLLGVSVAVTFIPRNRAAPVPRNWTLRSVLLLGARPFD